MTLNMTGFLNLEILMQNLRGLLFLVAFFNLTIVLVVYVYEWWSKSEILSWEILRRSKRINNGVGSITVKFMFLRLSLRWLMSFFIFMLISRWVVGSLLKSRKWNQMFQQMLSVVLHKTTFSGYKYYVGYGIGVSCNAIPCYPGITIKPWYDYQESCFLF